MNNETELHHPISTTQANLAIYRELLVESRRKKDVAGAILFMDCVSLYEARARDERAFWQIEKQP